MGKQILIIGMAGTYSAALASEIVKQLSARGLQVHHASVRYEGQVHFATGGPDDLKESLREYAVQAAAVNTPETVTLDVINGNVLEVLKILKRHEPKSEKAPKQEKKKGAPEDRPLTPQPESQPQEQPSSPPTGDGTNTDAQPPTTPPPTEEGSGPKESDPETQPNSEA